LCDAQPQTAAGYTTLKSIGFTAAALVANRAAPQLLSPPLLRSKLPWYVEDIATELISRSPGQLALRRG
jgi:hypothetical protein